MLPENQKLYTITKKKVTDVGLYVTRKLCNNEVGCCFETTLRVIILSINKGSQIKCFCYYNINIQIPDFTCNSSSFSSFNKLNLITANHMHIFRNDIALYDY